MQNPWSILGPVQCWGQGTTPGLGWGWGMQSLNQDCYFVESFEALIRMYINYILHVFFTDVFAVIFRKM